MGEIKYYPPEYKSKNFHCPFCDVYADQHWWKLFSRDQLDNTRDLTAKMDLDASSCGHCGKFSLWIEESLHFPVKTGVPNPNTDMPDGVRKLYEESAQVLPYSPRAAAALLRLGLQVFLGEVGGRGKNINNDIKTIVAAGIEPETQKALDIIRVFGNNGAHPGEIQIEENLELVNAMFGLMNFITDRLITQKKQINSMFDNLPAAIKEQVNVRDNGDKKDEV